MTDIKVLLIDDEQSLAMIIKDTLDRQGFKVTVVHDAENGLKTFVRERPDIVVSEVIMPGMSGFEMINRLRQYDKFVPVLFLSSQSTTDDIVKGFEAGANDYLKKPFSMLELVVRIRALVGRKAPEHDVMEAPVSGKQHTSIEIGKFTFFPHKQMLQMGDKSQGLSYRESQILLRLTERIGRVVNTDSLLLDIWGDNSFYNSRSLQVFMTKLRHKLSADKHLRIINVRGVGYRMVVD